MKNYGVNNIYFFDTYAIIEILKGNDNYEKYKKNKVLTGILNIIELHYFLLRRDEQLARKITLDYSKFILPLTLDIIFEANIFRYKNKRKKISTADSIGYVLALKNNILFLTGDKEFKGLDNVEFVD